MHITKTFILCIILSLSGAVRGQSPYEFNFKQESKYVLGGATAYGLATLLQGNQPALTPKNISELELDDMLGLDRGVIYNSNHQHELLSDYIFNGSFALPLLFLTQEKTRKSFGHIGILYLETAMISGGITNLTKSAFKRPRPYVYNELADNGRKYSQNASRSFISGHTSLTATNTFFMAKVFNDFYPDSKLKPYIWTVAAVVPAVVGYFRVSSGNHFPTDVAAGYVIGASVGFLVPHLHKVRIGKDSHLNVNGGPGGISLDIRF